MDFYSKLDFQNIMYTYKCIQSTNRVTSPLRTHTYTDHSLNSGWSFKNENDKEVNTEFTVYYQDLENLQTSSQLQVFRHKPV